MPDGDKIHSRLSGRYQKPYLQICEGQYGAAELARDVARVLKRDLREYGSRPTECMARIAQELQQLPREPLLQATIDWSEQSRMIDRLAQQTKGNRRAIELVVQAGKQLLHELRYGRPVGNIDQALHERYVQNIYHANFEARIPLAPPPNGVPYETVAARLDDMRPHVEREIATLAAQLHRGKDPSDLRLHRRAKPSRSIDLHMDLSSLGL